MKKMRFLKYIFSFAFLFTMFSPSVISAKQALEVANAPGISQNEIVGTITLYDDYTIAFTYGYRVKDIVINICKDNLCDNVKEAENQTYLGNTSVEFDISKYIIEDDSKKVTYKIIASGNFKSTETSNLDSYATLNYTLTLTPNNEDPKDVLEASGKAIEVINTWVIPGIYIILAVTIIVKGILLSIDLVKYSDDREIRSEKIRAFVYLFVGVLCAAIIASTVGLVTGLFD